VFSVIGPIAAEFSAAFYFFAGFRQERALRSGGFCSAIDSRAWLAIEDFETLQRLMAEHPHWSRRRLSIALCEALNWRTASGQLKDMSARLLLNELAERGFIELLPRQSVGGRQLLRALSEPELSL
jgi:hypothetical protein